MTIIAGVGSRKTPESILKEMILIGFFCRENKIWVRSGRAPGADQAFSMGAGNFCIEYIPWSSFESSFKSGARECILKWPISIFHSTLVENHHPAPNKLTLGAFKLMARNCHQILGASLEDPVSAVICWTEGGLRKGGTAFALNLADDYDIPIFNMALPQYSTCETVTAELKKLMEK
jgi:hypothetical protein